MVYGFSFYNRTLVERTKQSDHIECLAKLTQSKLFYFLNVCVLKSGWSVL